MPYLIALNSNALLPLLPNALLACGGCTDRNLLISFPAAGYGILVVWAWIIAMLVARNYAGRKGRDPNTIVRPSTLIAFTILASVGYVTLVLLLIGSLLLPSLFIGFVWSLYAVTRCIVGYGDYLDVQPTRLGLPFTIHATLLLALVGSIIYWQVRASTLDHCISCLHHGNVSAIYTKVLPTIVDSGQSAVKPLIEAASQAMNSKDGFSRLLCLKREVFCLGQIGGPDAEAYLKELLMQHAIPSNYEDVDWYRVACLSYARCAGPQATDDLIKLFEQASQVKNQQDERWILLVALAMTKSKRGIDYVLNHMDTLLEQTGGNGSRFTSVDATVECLVYGKNAEALEYISAYCDRTWGGDMSFSGPRPKVYNPKLFEATEDQSQLGSPQEVKQAWKQNSKSIRKRWDELLKDM